MKVFSWAAALATLAVFGSAVAAPRGEPAQARGDSTIGGALTVLQLRPNFFMIAGAGGNIGVQIGDDGVVVVDSGSASNADAVVAAIKKISPQPIRYVINTGPDADHVGGNASVSRAGQTLFTGGGGPGIAPSFIGGAASISRTRRCWHGSAQRRRPVRRYQARAGPPKPSTSRGSTCI